MGDGTLYRPFLDSVLVNAEASLLVGVWWMLREIELANLEKGGVVFKKGLGCGIAMICVSHLLEVSTQHAAFHGPNGSFLDVVPVTVLIAMTCPRHFLGVSKQRASF